jgi:K+-transporting ATPase A subunit
MIGTFALVTIAMGLCHALGIWTSKDRTRRFLLDCIVVAIVIFVIVISLMEWSGKPTMEYINDIKDIL